MSVQISAKGLEHKELNERIKNTKEKVIINDCMGQRFIGCGLAGREIEIFGTPGNALGAYLDGSVIKVNGNAQDAVGDTMNDGRIIIDGHIGDAAGYAMRGGAIFVRQDAGYRAGIHMKEYKDKKPALIIGGRAGSFLGEYLAGGLIIVLGLSGTAESIVGNFTGTGMHGGKIFIRSENPLPQLPKQVSHQTATDADIDEISPYIAEFAKYFSMSSDEILKSAFQKLTPNAKSPYKQLYTAV